MDIIGKNIEKSRWTEPGSRGALGVAAPAVELDSVQGQEHGTQKHCNSTRYLNKMTNTQIHKYTGPERATRQNTEVRIAKDLTRRPENLAMNPKPVHLAL